MDADEFRRKCEDPKRSRGDLVNLRNNANAKNRPDLAVIAESVLAERFPPFGERSGRGTPTRVAFRGEERVFDTAKAAYLWLLEKFVAMNPDLLTTPDWRHAFIAEGRQRRYFAQSPKDLFDGSPHLADDATMYAQLSNGWFVNLNIGNDQKLGILAKVAAVSEFKIDVDWAWEVMG